MGVYGKMKNYGENLVGSLTGTTAKDISEKNLKLQRENLDWQKQVQQTTWQREDNAQQRAVADLKSAGLSPVLAAGQGAGSGGIVQTSAPQQEDYSKSMPGPETVLALLSMKANVARTIAAANNAQIDAAIKRRELRIVSGKEVGQRYYGSALGKLFTDAKGAALEIINKLGDAGSKFGKDFGSGFSGSFSRPKLPEKMDPARKKKINKYWDKIEKGPGWTPWSR